MSIMFSKRQWQSLVVLSIVRNKEWYFVFRIPYLNNLIGIIMLFTESRVALLPGSRHSMLLIRLWQELEM